VDIAAILKEVLNIDICKPKMAVVVFLSGYTRFSSQSPVFIPRIVYVKFMLDKVALQQFFF
jgi:hypothetical protein